MFRLVHVRSNRVVFEAIAHLASNGSPVDPASVTDALLQKGILGRAGGSYQISKLEYYADIPNRVTYHARMLANLGLKRKALGIARKVEDDLLNGKSVHESIDSAQSSFLEIGKAGTSHIVNLSDLARELESELPILGGTSPRVSSGLESINKILGGGFTPGELFILAARPSMGKTALALSMLHRLSVLKNKPSAFFSLEMSAKSLLSRVVAIDSGRSLSGSGSSSDASSVVGSLGRVSSSPIYIDETSALPIFDLRARARRLVESKGVEVIFVDYLPAHEGRAWCGQTYRRSWSDISGPERYRSVSSAYRLLPCLSSIATWRAVQRSAPSLRTCVKVVTSSRMPTSWP